MSRGFYQQVLYCVIGWVDLHKLICIVKPMQVASERDVLNNKTFKVVNCKILFCF